MSSQPQTVKTQTVVTSICYCPHLGLYQYKRGDGSEYSFDAIQLEKSVETYLKNGNEREANFMAQLTSWARTFPHKIVTFMADVGGETKFEVRDPPPPPVHDVIDVDSTETNDKGTKEG